MSIHTCLHCYKRHNEYCMQQTRFQTINQRPSKLSDWFTKMYHKLNRGYKKSFSSQYRPNYFSPKRFTEIKEQTYYYE